MIGGVFFGGVGGGVAFPTLPTLGTVLGISSFVVGAILSINRFTRLVMATPTGQLLDSVGTRKPRLVGLFVQGLVPFGYVLALDPGPVPLQCGDLLPLAGLLGGSAFVFVGGHHFTHVTTAENRRK